MHQLLLLRHAKSLRGDPRLADRDRPLAPRGHRDAGLMRQSMRRLGLAPDLVLVSNARRTMETLDALEPWDDTPLTEPTEQLYLAEAAQIFTLLRDVAETVRSVLLIGHNPGVQDFAVQLAAPASGEAARRMSDKFPTAALAEFAIGCAWRRLDRGTAHLTRFVMPADLRDKT